MNYPQRIITQGEKNVEIVQQIQIKLNELGCTPVAADGVFGRKTAQAVKDFQSRHCDVLGNPLVIDGKVGIQTWTSLFEDRSVSDDLLSLLTSEVLKTAQKEIGVCEVPPGSNRGPVVNDYLKRVGLRPGNPWCAAFVYWCFSLAAEKLNMRNPVVKTGGCMVHWRRTQGVKILSVDAVNEPSIIKPGAIFIINRGGGKGHTGIVTHTRGGYIQTIEGNTNAGLSAEGGGVCMLWRKINTINTGFIFYG